LRYRDVEAAIEWLCGAFGFMEYNVVSEPDGAIRHAQLILGGDMIMLLPASPSEGDGAEAKVEESTGSGAQSLYFVVDDAEDHHRRATAAGAAVLENGQYAFGGHGYSCRDPEGHIWHFGTYNPRGEETTDRVWIRDFLYGNRAPDLVRDLRDRLNLNPAVLVAGAAAVVVAIATVVWMLVGLPQTSANARERGLAFRAVAAPQKDGETALRALARIEERPLAKVARESSTTPPRAEDASARESARSNRHALASTETSRRIDDAPQDSARQIAADRTIEETLGKVRAARQAAEQSVEEALERVRTAQRSAAQAFRQSRAARKATAATQPRPAETRDQLAAVSTAAPAPEQKATRERAGKETPAAKEAPAKGQVKESDSKATGERTGKDARNASAAGEWQTRATTPAAQPVKVLARQAKEPNTDQGWECVPSPPSGQIVCHPVGKKPASAKAAATKLFEITEEPPQQQTPPVEQRQLPEPRRTQEQSAGAPTWDCQPTPPDGQILCRPTGGTGQRR
jgi:uncharacterized glyoxalase superfamily protein PhnB